jgi:NitT/TauT family transport system permease protein
MALQQADSSRLKEKRPSGEWWQLGDFGATVVVVICLLGAMEVSSWYVAEYIMPSPLTVARAIVALATTDYTHVLITLGRLCLAMLFAMTAGIILGLVMGLFGVLRPFISALVVIDSGIPALSWILLAVFWFKNPEVRIFFILAMILVPFYALTIYDGIRGLPRDLLDMIESFRANRTQVLRYLIIPHLVPYVLTTTKAVVGYAIRMVIFAELVASAVGVGSRMGLAQSTFRMDQVLAWTFFLIVLNISLQAIVAGIEKLVLHWRPEATVR